MVKIRYICDICNTALDKDNKCNKGCNITVPKLCIDVLSTIEDGTERASLRILDQQAISAFNIRDNEIVLFKQYCTEYGNYFHPRNDSPNETMQRNILRVFKQAFSFSRITVLAVPFCKIKTDKNAMNEMVSRPNYVLSESEKNMGIYLNGEITRKWKGNKTIRKVNCSFKAIEVREPDLNSYLLE